MIVRRRQQVVDCVRREAAAGRPFPTLSLMAGHLGCSLQGARDAIDGAKAKGDLVVKSRTKLPGQKRWRYEYGLPDPVPA